jgi:hypothetical protein
MATTWTYEDEKICCKFFLKHGIPTRANIGNLMKELNYKFPEGSVKLKLKNYEFIHTKGISGMANTSFRSKYVYRQLTAGKGAGIPIARKHTADAANIAIRNILTMLSIYTGEITAAEMDKTNKFFNYCCPYTGKDISKAIANRLAGIPDASIAIDHIVPQNREFCGLNIYGNLVWTDSAANNRKGGKKDYKQFLLTDKTIASTATPAEIQARIDKIEDFQRYSGYDSLDVVKTISPLLKQYYEDIQSLQVNTAAEIAKAAKL